jgi:hypothetical protein
LAGSLKLELESKYGIRPKIRHAYHELEVIVDGRSVFAYSRAQRIPTVESLMHLVEVELSPVVNTSFDRDG